MRGLPSDTIRRRRLAAAVLLAVAALLAGVAIGAGSDDKPSKAVATQPNSGAKAPKPLELPRGGRRLFPDHRIVAFYGNPRARELGTLGIGTPVAAAERLRKQSKPYDLKTRPAIPAFELIATIANADAGADGLYRTREDPKVIGRYLRAARKAKALLILDIQPGRAPFGPEIEALARWLREPDVGLALDPEWHVGAGQVPGKVIGSMDAEAVNAAAAYLSKLVKERGLPEKLLLVHRFTDDMIERDARLRSYPGVATVVNVDGFGGREVKVAKYRSFVARTPNARRGFKLFYEEDAGLMTPKSVMAMTPRPDVVVYE